MKELIARIRGYIFLWKYRYTGKNIFIGQGLKLYCKLEIRGEGKITIGKNCTIAGISGDRRHYVTIYTHTPGAEIAIGDNAKLFAARISAKFSITIGDDFLIEESGMTDTDFHSLNLDRGTPIESREKCRVRIGDRVSIGARSVICKGVTVGDDVLIAPGSIITKSIPAGSFACGNPAKVVRSEARLAG
ncbi:MAG: acyltransferase [Candidatus Competibacteraceae bacterium]